MYCNENGVIPGSDFYHFTPSEFAKETLFYFTSVGHFLCDFGYIVKREDYANYMLLYVNQGALAVESEGKKYVAKSGNVVLLNCHIPHKYYSLGNLDFLWIHINGSNMEAFYKHIINRMNSKVILHMDNVAYFENTLYEIVSKFRNEQPTNEFESSQIIYELLLRMAIGNGQSLEESSSSFEPYITSAIGYIKEHLASQISVTDIADHVGLSQYYFTRKFKQALHVSPYEYLILQRLNTAKHLLKTTDMTIKEITYHVGYSSESNFINAFINKIGISPKKFRAFPI
ncbi:MAG: AraC family transcriptional regulator [Lachnospiraceae bacterium]